MFELKLLSKDGIAGALAKAERYRLLNEPEEAESIYLDVLDVDPNNQQAVVGLLLSLTDQFDYGLSGLTTQARALLPRIQDEYEHAYYAGIICERRAKTLLHQVKVGASGMAFDLLSEAKHWYQQAEALRPAGNDDVLLRWNACARLIMRHPQVATAQPERFQPYVDA